MFALKKKCYCLVAHLLLLAIYKNKFVLDYEDVYCALMLVDCLKSLIEHVSS